MIQCSKETRWDCSHHIYSSLHQVYLAKKHAMVALPEDQPSYCRLCGGSSAAKATGNHELDFTDS